jgi:galactosylceramidase
MTTKEKQLGKKAVQLALSALLAVQTFGGLAAWPTSASAAPTVVNISGTDLGRTYEGVGGVFSNGMTKLLMDYPANQRNDILDLLFKPKFGASLDHVKVEIGTDVNSSSGTEPSHMRSSTDFDITRGSGLWIAQKAKALNPAIKLEALRWGTPAWISTDADRYLYYKKFLQGAQTAYGLTFDYLASDKNEDTQNSDWGPTSASRSFVVNTLRPGLNADGFSNVGIVAADSNKGFWIADRVQSDSALKSALAALNAHYTSESSTNAVNSGLPLWAGEDLAPLRTDFVKGPLDMAHRIMKNYTIGKMTKYEMHPVIESSYPNTPFNTKSILVAQTPWTGRYEIQSGLWATAHFTQFAGIGWKYINGGTSTNDQGGYMTLKDPSSSNWSLIVLNTSAASKSYTFNLSGSLSTGTVRPWKTTETAQFIQQPNITPSSGSFTVTIDPYSLYTFTTTTGQQKGTAANSNPSSGAFSLAADYTDNFDSYSAGKQPKYFSDQGGAFEIATEGSGKALTQVITAATKPSDWKYRTTPDPYTIMGSVDWRNYEVQSDVKLTGASGYVMVGGRVNHNRKTIASEGADVPAGGYHLKINADDTWQLRAAARVIASGTYSSFAANTWFTVKLRFTGTNIKAYINPVSNPSSVTLLADVTDTEFPSGQVQLGSGYNTARFDNLAVREASSSIAVDIKRYNENDPNMTYVGAWEAVSADYENYDRSQVGSRTADSKLQFAFNGSTVILIGTPDVDGGLADVYLDGSTTPDATIDLYSDTRLHRRAVYTKSGLAAGGHTLKLVAKGTHAPASIDSFVRIDAVEIGGGSNTLSKLDYQFINDTFTNAAAGTAPPNWVQTTQSGTASTVELDSTAKKLKLNDTNAANRAILERKFAPASGTVTWEFDYKRTTSIGSWNRFFLMNNGASAVELYDTDSAGFAYNTPGGTKVNLMNLTAGTSYAIKVAANTVTDTFEVWIDGVKKTGATAPSFMNTGIDRVDRMRVETSGSNSATTTAYLDNVSITAPGGTSQTVIRDTFDEYANGTKAQEARTTINGIAIQKLDWNVDNPDSTNNCTVTTSLPGGGDNSFKCTDTLTTGHVHANRDFERKTSGYVTAEYKFRQDSVGKWTRLFVSNGSDNAIELYDSSTAGGLAFKDAAGSEILLGSLAAGTWYTVKLVIDVDDQKFDAFLDGVPKLMNQPFTNSTFNGLDRITFQTGDSTTVNLYLDYLNITLQ